MKNTKPLTQILLTILLCSLTTVLKAQNSIYFSTVQSQNSNGDYVYQFYPNETNIINDYPLESTDAFYTYFWSFGDGSYSFEDSPSHTYFATETLEVMMIATPRYSPIPPPPSFNLEISVQGSGTISFNDNPMLLLDRAPRPGYSSLVILNYKNSTASTISDPKLRLYINTEYFEYQSTIDFNNEIYLGFKSDNSLLPNYNGYLEFNLESLSPQEGHSFFVDLETSLAAIGAIGEPLADLYLRAELRQTCQSPHCIEIMEAYDYKTQAVGSWDPNSKYTETSTLFLDDLQSLPARINYRINFQNLGTSPAKNVTINDMLPDELDFSSLNLIDHYHPEILLSDSFTYVFNPITGRLKCTFHNINLAGLNQLGASNPEKTKGYITFSITTKLHLSLVTSIMSPKYTHPIDSCIPYDSIVNKAEIIFDSNPPIVTNETKIDLYYSESASCFSRPIPKLDVVPNPVVDGTIGIKVCNVPIIFPYSSIIYQIINPSTGEILTCNLNPTIQSNWNSNACFQINLTPSCLDPGYYIVVIIYNGATYRLNVVVN
ncbi:MAG: PKD domain-containing protein [Flavobacteriales bacterium]|nr:PKD domain-containing protein [Flavobacteriales bacterium]